MSKLPRGQGVGADSSDEASLTASNLDFDLNPDEIDGKVQMFTDKLKASETLSLSEVDNVCAELQKAVVSQPGFELHESQFASGDQLERAVMGSESGEVRSARSILEREIDGLESDIEDEDANKSSGDHLSQAATQISVLNNSEEEHLIKCGEQQQHSGNDQEYSAAYGVQSEFPTVQNDAVRESKSVKIPVISKVKGEDDVEKDVDTVSAAITEPNVVPN